MTDPEETFYTEDRWGNWIDRVSEESLDPDDKTAEEDSARLLMNMQNDTALAVAKIVSAFDAGRIDEDRALAELDDVLDIVFDEVSFDDGDKEMFVGSVQQSLEPVVYAAREYVVAGPAEEGTVGDYVQAAREEEAADDPEAALGFLVKAGTLVIDGEELSPEIGEELEFGLVSEWVNGLESLQSALAGPEVVEEDDD